MHIGVRIRPLLGGIAGVVVVGNASGQPATPEMPLPAPSASTGSTPPANAASDVPRTGGPLRLPYDPDAAPPVGYHVERFPRRGLVIGGAIPFGIFYGIAFLQAISLTPNEKTDALLVPVFGPFFALRAIERCDPNTDPEEVDLCEVGSVLEYTWYGWNATGQVTGATLLTIGLLARKKWYVRDDVSLAILPSVPGADVAGLTVLGRF